MKSEHPKERSAFTLQHYSQSRNNLKASINRYVNKGLRNQSQTDQETSCWLAFTLLEGAIEVAREEKTSMDSASYDTDLPSKMYVLLQ